jgi:hypothetical protein
MSEYSIYTIKDEDRQFSEWDPHRSAASRGGGSPRPACVTIHLGGLGGWRSFSIAPTIGEGFAFFATSANGLNSLVISALVFSFFSSSLSRLAPGLIFGSTVVALMTCSCLGESFVPPLSF